MRGQYSASCSSCQVGVGNVTFDEAKQFMDQHGACADTTARMEVPESFDPPEPTHRQLRYIEQVSTPERADREGDTQPLPEPSKHPVAHHMVMDDLNDRLRIGIRRYGQPVQPFNGRDSLRDAYEEVLDLAVYLRARLYEEEYHPDVVFHTQPDGTILPEWPDPCPPRHLVAHALLEQMLTQYNHHVLAERERSES